ncbi:MAG: hypothetical protein QM765_52155 [Myxococcales bacterium]
MRRTQPLALACAAAASLLCACPGPATSDPDTGRPTADASTSASDASPTASDASTPAADASTLATDAGAPAADAGLCSPFSEDVTGCSKAPTDYQPRQGHLESNGWPACVSDDNTWHLIGTDVPAASARSAAYDQMAALLWDNPVTPTKADFLAARDAYSVDSGLASRVARRQDIHYDEVPGGDKFACQQAGVPAQYPDRCTGPATLKPLIDQAFEQGLAGSSPRLQAARIRAGLDWFLYLSLGSEIWTCSFNNLADCDSAAGYYSQLSARSEPKGIARSIAALGPETHERIHDALLAARCWRDADQAMPTTNTALYDLAQAQLHQAALRGMGLLLRDQISRIACSTGEERDVHAVYAKTLGTLLSHDAGLIDAAEAAKLKAYTNTPTSEPADVAAALASIDQIFECP